MNDNPLGAYGALTPAQDGRPWPMDDLRGRILREINEQSHWAGGVAVGIAVGLGLLALLVGLA